MQCMNFIKEHKKFIKVRTLKKGLKKKISGAILLNILIGKLDIKVQSFDQKLVVNGKQLKNVEGVSDDSHYVEFKITVEDY